MNKSDTIQVTLESRKEFSQFDPLAEVYEQSVTDLTYRRPIEMHSFFQVLGTLDGLSVLDFGCGNGLYTRNLRRKAAACVVGMDVSEGMITYARNREQQERLGIQYFLRDATATVDNDPEIDRMFDLVTAVYVLPYASTEQKLSGFAQTARRALRSEGGRFVSFVLNPQVSREPNWYRPYNMDITLMEGCKDGTVGQLKIWSTADETPLINFYYWSKEAHERALRSAGFGKINWIRPWLSEEGHPHYDDMYWKKYLECPHALILDCKAAPEFLLESKLAKEGDYEKK